MTLPGMTGGSKVRSIAWRDLVRSFYARFEPGGLWPRARETVLSVSGSRADEPGLARPIVWAKRAVLLVDVVESVRLIEQDEAGAIARWLSFVEQVKTRILPEWNGRVVKSLGDGLLLDFDDVRTAAAAAFAIQQASNRVNSGLPPERQMHLRMGLEVGDVVVESDDVHGRGVNLAARLMSLAGPGEIVVSAHARDEMTADLDAEIEDLGDCYVRHMSEPVRAYRIGPPGPRPVIKRYADRDDLAPSIAVVPFAPRLTSHERDVIGELFAEEIIRALSRTPDLSVISRLSTTALRGRHATLTEINALLGADYVLSGVYTSDGVRVSLDAELADAKSGKIVWTARLNDRVSGILSGEPEIIGRIVAEISSAIMERELQRARSQPLPTLRAYSLLFGAISLMHRLSLSDFDQARQLLQSLVERGIHHPIPHAWLAHWYVLRVQQGWSSDPHQDAYLALESTNRALDMDPKCSLALAVDGLVHTNLLKRLDVADQRYDAAIDANPSNALAWLLKGTLHAFMDDGHLAVECSQKSLKLTPLDPHRYFYESLTATAHVTAGNFERAQELALSSLRLNRKHTSTLRVLAVSQWHLGQHEEARKTARELMSLEPNLTVSRWLERAPGGASKTGREFARVLRLIGVPA